MTHTKRLARGLAMIALLTTPLYQLVAEDSTRAKPRVVSVTAYDYRFESPVSVPAGTYAGPGAPLQIVRRVRHRFSGPGAPRPRRPKPDARRVDN